MLVGYTYGNWAGTNLGGADFAAVKLTSDGEELWRWQVRMKNITGQAWHEGFMCFPPLAYSVSAQ